VHNACARMSRAFDDDSDDEGEVPPLLGPGDVHRPSMPSVPKSVPASNASCDGGDGKPPAPRPTAAAMPPVSSAGESNVGRAKPGAHLKPNNGLKKGFLSGGGSSQRATNKATGSGSSNGSELPLMRGSADAKQKSLELPEVQSKMEADKAEAAKLGAGGQNSWMTPELMAKIAASPLLRKGFMHPGHQQAMAEMTSNPQEAMRKYADVPEMREFLQAFAKLMSEHFSALADKQEAEKRAEEERVAASLTPEQRKAQEVAQAAMSDPEVRAIVAEPKIQQLLQNMQTGQSFELEKAIATDPEVVRKLKKLSAAGLIGMEWRQ